MGDLGGFLGAPPDKTPTILTQVRKSYCIGKGCLWRVTTNL
jgi:hypothetical protein